MKTKNPLLKIFANRAGITALAFAIILSAANVSFGQSKCNYGGSDIKKSYTLTSFKVKCIEGKAYVKWEVIEPNGESLYLLERSVDNHVFTPLYAKQSIESPGDNQLLHCFIDEYPLANESYYRIRRFNKEGIVISEVVKTVNNERSYAEISISRK
ncbi:MAG: hypothetical protein HYU69_14165 [Bacteroidetes bacterium]|nr:hypothetical protein [Bacteroidota bacterium]